ncbi:DUF5615 family PIN-like protein [Ferrimicrobium acidiphilum]|jgi:predicted nuclease of predicted toxin-antitoxin system|uniref:DUF5615 domain-containing protein n=1 Tax=Ferrimicrobium acidiphilum DSM 19497 TaxID=1121877 RepID=A0A0D8FYJ4_9ACTN|nr:DUF5615 family PIN-like protein [Ferrimicrobium acidiphilum]KJE77447.1 hypothetical protein FEAC_08810 [Ferrimicrobium acidiphilum DSM 19497]MCL5052644.1 DUF5615 family PIN-like protein [Gammaproteobacteria bacterium]
MQFVVDAQLPPALARWITCQGYDALHLIDLGMLGAKDQEIWALGRHEGSIIVSKDSDFAALSLSDNQGPPVLWLRLANCRTPELIRILTPLWPLAIDRLTDGEKLVELRG